MATRHTPFNFVQIAQAVFEICELRLKSIGYKNGKEITYSLLGSFTPNASACVHSHEPICHAILINEGLLTELHRVCNAFSETSLHREASNVLSPRHALFQIMFKTGIPDANAIIYRFAMAFVYFHEAGHLNQQHKKFRDSLQCETYDIPFDELDEGAGMGSTEVSGIESALRQSMELMADYEGVIRTLEFIKAISIDHNGKLVRDTTAFVWLAVIGVCLVFYVFQGPKALRPLMPIHGIHPRPASRMLMIARWIADYVRRDPTHFPGLADEERCAGIIEEALISASQFWYTYKNALAETGHSVVLPVMHEEMKISADFQAWQNEISMAWQMVVRTINQQRVCPGVPLPEVAVRFTPQ